MVSIFEKNVPKLMENFIFTIENWYEERLALDQEYRLNPDKRMVSFRKL